MQTLLALHVYSFPESSHIGNYGASISTLQAKAALEQNQQHLRAKTTPFQ